VKNQSAATTEKPTRGAAADEGVPTISAIARKWEKYVALGLSPTQRGPRTLIRLAEGLSPPCLRTIVKADTGELKSGVPSGEGRGLPHGDAQVHSDKLCLNESLD